jgi:transaldolase
VERLIAPGVINTMPEPTLRAFADHGNVERALDTDMDEVERTLAAAADAGLDLARVTSELEREGVDAFCDSYRELLSCLESKRERVGATGR